MGYTKIVQFGNITELYEYEKEIKWNPWKSLEGHQRRLAKMEDSKRGLSGRPHPITDVKKKRQKALREESKKKGVYIRSEASIKRSRQNFFRLCHHNNHLAKTIHFLTLTFAYDLPYKTACRHVARFMEKVQGFAGEISVSYISVPELTEAGRFHFHLLVYNLPTRISGEPRWYKTRKGNVWYTTERETRNLQRHFERGYVDIVPAFYTSRGIAGYMAKYMGKSLIDSRYETTRGYNCSRGIAKIYSAGSNTFAHAMDITVPTENLVSVESTEYNVPYLGNCRYTKIIKMLE